MDGTTRAGWRSIGGRVGLWAGLAVVFASAGGAQPAEPAGAAPAPDPWATVRPLVGAWEASLDGAGAARRCEWVLNDRYVFCRAALVRPPAEGNPRGDLHEELAVFSFDRERRALVYREFVVEGFVNTYLCDGGQPGKEPGKLVCTSESVENGPGVRARLTFEIADRFRFVEVFEVAWPGKELEIYATNRWSRVPELPD